MNYRQTMEYIEGLGAYASKIVPGLENIRNLCGELGNPQEELKVVHIAGTNGKGSVLAYISTIMQCAGYKTGRFVSPPIFAYREIIQINQRPISQKKLCEYAERVKAACESLVASGRPHPTRFEFETAMAFLYFRQQGCDLAVIETGMGGRLDATNIIEHPLVTAIASVSMDHMKFLGGTLSEIAREKAGICKPGHPVVAMEQEPEAERAILQRARELGCPVTIVSGRDARHVRPGLETQKFDGFGMRDLEIHLAGECQIVNALLALAAVGKLADDGFPVREAQLRRGLAGTRWPGRLDVIGREPLFIADGAHNQDAAKKLADFIRFYFTNKRIVYIMGILKDKEYEKIIAETYAYADQIITVTPPDNPRAMPAYELAQAVQAYHPRATAADSLEEAVEMAYMLAGREDVIISFGSLSYLGRLVRIVERRSQRKK